MTGITGSWVVPTDVGRIRLDQFLLRLIPGESRSRIQNWIRSGQVSVDGLTVKTGHRVRAGESIQLALPAEAPLSPQPEAIPLAVLYEDQDIAVIDKPAGMVCHAGAGVRSGTLVNALLHRYGLLEAGDPMRPGIVHRLDKLTSGLLVVARNPAAHRHLSQQFRNRKVQKVYWAMVHGRPLPPFGTVDLPLGRDPRDRKKISSRAPRGRSALTHYRVQEQVGRLAILEVRIETGRTHQIRAHLAHKGHPVVGDPVYGGGRDRTLPPELARILPNRYCLHAFRLDFQHPASGVEMSFTAPLPAELASFLSVARAMAPPKR